MTLTAAPTRKLRRRCRRLGKRHPNGYPHWHKPNHGRQVRCGRTFAAFVRQLVFEEAKQQGIEWPEEE